MSGLDDDEGPKSRTGRFTLTHRGNTRVEVGEPVHVGGARPWLCAVKLLGRNAAEPDTEATQTLLVRTGRGTTPEEAQRDAMAQLTLVYGTPVGPPPSTRISQLSIAEVTADEAGSSTDIQASRGDGPRTTPVPSVTSDPFGGGVGSGAASAASAATGSTSGAGSEGTTASTPATSTSVSRWLKRLFGRTKP